MKKLIQDLNPEQRRAVTTTRGPVLVLAGAGTGKTRVITVRIAYLLSKGVSAENILAMTFTNKAAAEMRQRVAGLVGNKKAKPLSMGTFHSFCLRSLKRYAKAVGLDGGFSLCDGSDQLAAVKNALRELRIRETAIHPAAARSRISLLKNQLGDPSEFLDKATDEKDELVARIWKGYQEQLRRSRLLDFDDLLLLMVKLLNENEEALEGFQKQFQYLLVDEYQDTNEPQYQIVRKIAAEHQNLCVVGDDDQSIYSWRGADIKKILGFQRDFRKTTVVRLETNYRSTSPILEAANLVIRHNPSRHEKSLRSAAGAGNPVLTLKFQDETAEAEYVVKDMLKLTKEGAAKLKDFAILVRTQVLNRVFEAQLRMSGVPYRLVGGMSFFDRKEIRDVLAFLRLVVNPLDEISLLRIINRPPRGVGKTTIDRVLAFASDNGLPAASAFERVKEIDGIPKAGREAYRLFRERLDSAGIGDDSRDLVERIKKLLDVVSYREEVVRCYSDVMTRDTRWAGVMEILNFGENYTNGNENPTLAGFLDELTLSSGDDRDDTDKSIGDQVTLMTLHAAKGLEFPRVHLVAVEEGILPHKRSVEENGVEEERRLMYVGITRAQRHLTVTVTKERAQRGRKVKTMPSRFVYEMLDKDPPKGWEPVGQGAQKASESAGQTKKKRRKSKGRKKKNSARRLRKPA